jgi:hypothetical protein
MRGSTHAGITRSIIDTSAQSYAQVILTIEVRGVEIEIGTMARDCKQLEVGLVP